jgi:hypothetical protein
MFDQIFGRNNNLSGTTSLKEKKDLLIAYQVIITSYHIKRDRNKYVDYRYSRVKAKIQVLVDHERDVEEARDKVRKQMDEVENKIVQHANQKSKEEDDLNYFEQACELYVLAEYRTEFDELYKKGCNISRELEKLVVEKFNLNKTNIPRVYIDFEALSNIHEFFNDESKIGESDKFVKPVGIIEITETDV